MPFRESHGAVAGLVRVAVTSGRTLSQLPLDEVRAHADAFDEEYYEVLQARSWLESKVSEGGTALARVREQLELARASLDR